MSNSKLATYIDTTTDNWNKRQSNISRITIHHAAGVGNCDMLSKVLKSGRECSWNYGIGNDGTIGLFVEECNRAWTSSNWQNDDKAVTIEVCNSTGDPDWKISEAAWNSLIDLCVDICQRNNIKQLTYTGQLSGSNLTMHQWFKSTSCPGPYLTPRFPNIRDQVNTKLKSNYKPTVAKLGKSSANTLLYTYPTNDAELDYIDPKDYVDSSKITPYIATIGPKKLDTDYKKLKSIGVVGVMLYGGSLYDDLHNEKSIYVADNLIHQVNQVDKSDLPYALYVDVRSRSVSEARKECNELYYVISKFPPKLGIWLRLRTPDNKYTNNNILKEYYTQIVNWGLKDKCGLYVTRNQLNKITWDDFYNDFLLWLVDNVNSTDKFENRLLNPEFFMLNN